MHDDAKLPTNAQRQKLCEMLQTALVEIRNLAGSGSSAQAFDLADTFHNLPKGMWQEDFSLSFFRDCFVAVYHNKYPATGRSYDYLAMVDRVIAMSE